MVPDKATLRASARAARKSIPPEAREERSERIRQHAAALPELARARVVGCYVSVGSEASTKLLLRELLLKDKVVAVPAILGDEMRFVRLQYPWGLAPGAHGIPEPLQPWEEVPGESIEVLFVPGLRFGRDGSRLGSGKGYYDRFLHAHPTPLRVGLAFAAQVDDSVPTDEHDEAMDVLVTEEGRQRIGRPAAAPE